MKLKHIFMFVSGLILSACNQTVDLYFYTNESWRFDTQIQYDEGLIDVFGQAASVAIGSEFGIPMVVPNASGAMDVMGIFLNLAKTELRKQGIDFNWRKADDTFIINVKGDTLQKFNQFSSGMAEITVLGDGQYHLQMDVLTLGELNPSLGEYSELTNAMFTYTFTLHAGHIYSSNADEQSGTKAIWHNPSQIDVVFDALFTNPVGVFYWLCAGLVCSVLSRSLRLPIRRNVPTVGRGSPGRASIVRIAGR
ncbi:hypothetical protein [Candidatus Villigracilis affinis]|uniref:hypothetical protein n=1 Tax=Candidatus Villigracilis affinis TaxID=3140682 RepID=UPI0031EAA66B